MNWTDLLPSLVIVFILYFFAIFVHLKNRRKRWGKVKSKSIQRNSIAISGKGFNDSELLFYDYVDMKSSLSPRIIILLSSMGGNIDFIDQFAVGFCLAEIKTIILKWKRDENKFHEIFSRIYDEIKIHYEKNPQMNDFYLLKFENKKEKYFELEKIFTKKDNSPNLTFQFKKVKSIQIENNNETIVLSKIISLVYS